MTDTTTEALGSGWPPPPFVPPGMPALLKGGGRIFSDVTFAQTSGYRPVQLDVLVPDTATPAPTVVWIHGGAWLAGDRRALPPTVDPELLFGGLLRAGIAVVRIDYRLSLEAPFPAQLHDAKAAIRYLRRFSETLGIDPDRIAAWGESAGGHLAALLGLTPDATPSLEGRIGVTSESSAVSAVVDWYGVADVTAILSTLHSPDAADPAKALLGDRREQWEDLAAMASPLTYVAEVQPFVSFLVVHGAEDSVVPLDQSVRFVAALRTSRANVEFVEVAAAEHCFFGHDSVPELITNAIDFLSRVMTSHLDQPGAGLHP